jgi:hypothetical protein
MRNVAGKPEENSEDRGLDGKVIFAWILGGKLWTGFMLLRMGTKGPCEHGNEPSGSIKGGEFLD